MSEQTTGDAADGDAPLSLAQAARLTGMPRRYLEEMIEAGHLAVTHAEKGGGRKARVSRNALATAGLLDPGGPTTGEAPEQAVPERTELQALIEIVREQSARIGSLEDQRFLLAGQLGGALERVRALEEASRAAGRAIPATGRIEVGAGPAAEKPGAPILPPGEAVGGEGETVALSSISGVLLRNGVQRLRVRLVKVAPALPRPFDRFRR